MCRTDLSLFVSHAESLTSPDQFAELLCDDMELPAGLFMQPIASAIRAQIDQHPGDLVAMDDEDRRVPIKVEHTYVQSVFGPPFSLCMLVLSLGLECVLLLCVLVIV